MYLEKCIRKNKQKGHNSRLNSYGKRKLIESWLKTLKRLENFKI